MDAVKLQRKIYTGYHKAAIRLGLPFDVYRSITSIDPIVEDNLVDNQLASFNVEWSYTRANKYGNSVWQVLVDGNFVNEFDYLVSATQTFFIAGKQSILPMLAVECNSIATIKRPIESVGTGFTGYSGYIRNNVIVLYQNCPVSMLYSNKGRQSNVNMPTSTNMPEFVCYVPFLGSTIIQTGDVLTDTNNVDYIIGVDERTDLGWRLILKELGA